MMKDALQTRELGQLRVSDLRAACQKRGLASNGKKEQLMARLVAAGEVSRRPNVPSTPTPPTPSQARAQKCSKVMSHLDALSRRLPQTHLEDPANPEMRGSSSSDVSQWCLTSTTVSDVGDPSHSWRWTWTKSPAGKDDLDSPLQEKPPRSPQDLGVQSHTPERNDAQATQRRRLREKSPARSGSTSQQRAMLSPVQRPIRRRIREKSPDPHARTRDDLRRLFAGSPIKDSMHSPAPQWLQGLRANHQAATGAATCSRPQASPAPRGCTSHLTATTPGRRLTRKTSLAEIVPRPTPGLVASTHKDIDPSEALMLLTKRELVEMCIECEEETDGTKAVLVQRLVKAHAATVGANPAARKACEDAAPDGSGGSPQEAASAPCVAAPARRLSGGVPPPPSSWYSSQVPDKTDVAPSRLSPEPSGLPGSPVVSRAFASSSQSHMQDLVANSPTPARPSTPQATDRSREWWSQVATRWPQIVANLRIARGNQASVPDSMTSPQHAGRKRPPGSPSIAQGFQSPKRHRSAAFGEEPPPPPHRWSAFALQRRV